MNVFFGVLQGLLGGLGFIFTLVLAQAYGLITALWLSLKYGQICPPPPTYSLTKTPDLITVKRDSRVTTC